MAVEVDALLLHEHDFEGDHLSRAYHGAIRRLGAGLRNARRGSTGLHRGA